MFTSHLLDMDWIPRSFLSSPARIRSSSDNHMMPGAIPNYSPSACAPSNYPRSFHPVTGLEISQCDMELPFNPLRVYPPPGIYQLPTAGWSDQFSNPQCLLEPSLEVGHLSSGTCYEPFGACNDISPSPLSLYCPQTLSGSPVYSPAIDSRNQDTICRRPSDIWPNTPGSDTTAPSEGWCKVKEEPDESPGPLLLAEVDTPVHVPTPTQIPQLVVDNAFSSPLPCDKNRSGLLIKLDSNAERALDDNQRVAVDQIPFKVLPASGLQCSVCGRRFTRRSNCLQHIKRHDPSCTKTHQCEICERPFGRKTDLKRHVETIHHGVRKFGCDQCGNRFSRQDTLARHKADGCRQKPRKSHPRRIKDSRRSSPPLPPQTSAHIK